MSKIVSLAVLGFFKVDIESN